MIGDGDTFVCALACECGVHNDLATRLSGPRLGGPAEGWYTICASCVAWYVWRGGAWARVHPEDVEPAARVELERTTQAVARARRSARADRN